MERDYLQSLFSKEVQKYGDKILTQKEITELNTRRLNGDDKARQEMIVRNLRLVRSLASKFSNPSSPEYMDLIQEGMIGLMRAVDKFDHTKTYVDEEGVEKAVTFATYAVGWIKSKIKLYRSKKGRTIATNQNIQSKINKVKEAAHKLEGELKRRPTVEEIAEECGMTVKMVTKMFLVPSTISMNAIMNTEDGDGDELSNFIRDKDSLSPSEVLSMIDDALNILENLKDLKEFILCMEGAGMPDRDLKVFGCRYGIFGYREEKTLEQVADVFGITRERVRQICFKIFKKRGNVNMPLSSAKELSSAVSKLKAGLELSSNTFDKETLWLAGISSKKTQRKFVTSEIDNSIEGILKRLEKIVETFCKEKSVRSKMLALIAAKDFNIPVGDACYILSLNIRDLGEIPDDLLDKIRSKYTLSILCSDPKEIWERQGQLFESQKEEANSLRKELEEEFRSINASIENGFRGLTKGFQDALIHRYQIGKKTAEVKKSIPDFAERADILPSEADGALVNIWKYITKSNSLKHIRSDSQYIDAVEKIAYFSLLLE